MTERLSDVVTQIQNIRQLEAVVTAMRGIAASRAQQGRALLPGIKAYTDIVSTAIGQAVSLRLAVPGGLGQPRAIRRGLILFCAEQGFAGAFSERVLNTVLRELAGTTIFLVGGRGAVVASERGIRPSWTASMPTHLDNIPRFANRLADAVYQHVAAGTVTAVDIVFARSSSRDIIDVARQSLLPIDLERLARPRQYGPALTTLAPGILLERLASEYVYAQLCEAAMHTFVSENEARTRAMSSAKKNIELKLTGLWRLEHHIRQEEITTEVTELAAGTQAVPRSH
jgi:F-type H+-transporting ATPase subunit gamma